MYLVRYRPGNSQDLQPTFRLFIMGTGFSSGELELRETDHTSETKAEIKNKWSVTSTPSGCLNGVHRNMFTFIFLLCVQGSKCVRERIATG